MKSVAGVIAGGVLLGGITGAIGAESARNACAPDYKQFCPDVKPGGGRIVKCLQEHAERLSPACKDSLKAAREKKKG
jgi:hypothetical protein